MPDTIGMLCVYCGKPWSGAMQVDADLAADGCDTCGHGQEITFRIEIKCDGCNRVVYVKEGRD